MLAFTISLLAFVTELILKANHITVPGTAWTVTWIALIVSFIGGMIKLGGD